jgi:hypothetical protein
METAATVAVVFNAILATVLSKKYSLSIQQWSMLQCYGPTAPALTTNNIWPKFF